VSDRVLGIVLPLGRPASVNVWLLHGEPLASVGTGRVSQTALAALEEELHPAAGNRDETIEFALVTYPATKSSNSPATPRASVHSPARCRDASRRVCGHICDGRGRLPLGARRAARWRAVDVQASPNAVEGASALTVHAAVPWVSEAFGHFEPLVSRGNGHGGTEQRHLLEHRGLRCWSMVA
jgi:hypothetical protein